MAKVQHKPNWALVHWKVGCLVGWPDGFGEHAMTEIKLIKANICQMMIDDIL